MRRSGKSVLLEQIQEELKSSNPQVRIFAVSLDDDENKHFLEKGVLYKHLNNILNEAGDEMVYLFLDEIHDVEEWETAVNSIRMRKNADVYITGSNSKLLSGELSTYLTGRYVEIRMTPFSFAEFIEAASPIFPGEDTTQLFNRYLMTGAFRFSQNWDTIKKPVAPTSKICMARFSLKMSSGESRFATWTCLTALSVSSWQSVGTLSRRGVLLIS